MIQKKYIQNIYIYIHSWHIRCDVQGKPWCLLSIAGISFPCPLLHCFKNLWTGPLLRPKVWQTDLIYLRKGGRHKPTINCWNSPQSVDVVVGLTSLNGGFLKWWYPTTIGCPLQKMIISGCFWVPPFKETPKSQLKAGRWKLVIHPIFTSHRTGWCCWPLKEATALFTASWSWRVSLVALMEKIPKPNPNQVSNNNSQTHALQTEKTRTRYESCSRFMEFLSNPAYLISNHKPLPISKPQQSLGRR